ncbi:hypothetical protein TRIUR3_18896 [Triticum urartu]|uniref:Uncharacterized protein n=1 Tax=Triticum urartu TaxID=4572 RepID=M7YMM6_TRIUA|nr:hypothetical protein TRIUR3_18896 [Triticum urartu]
MARATVPLNFNALLGKSKLKDDGSNYTDWVSNLGIILISAPKNYVLDAQPESGTLTCTRRTFQISFREREKNVLGMGRELTSGLGWAREIPGGRVVLLDIFMVGAAGATVLEVGGAEEAVTDLTKGAHVRGFPSDLVCADLPSHSDHGGDRVFEQLFLLWPPVDEERQISHPMSGERSHAGWSTGSWISWTKLFYWVKLLVPGHQCQGGIGQRIIVYQGKLMENNWILRHSTDGGLLLWSIRGVRVTEADSYEEIAK